MCPVLTVRLSRCWRGVNFEEITKPNTGSLVRVVITRRKIILSFEQFKNTGKLSTYNFYLTPLLIVLGRLRECNYFEDFRFSSLLSLPWVPEEFFFQGPTERGIARKCRQSGVLLEHKNCFSHVLCHSGYNFW